MRLTEINPQFCLVMGGAGSGKNYFIEHDAKLSQYVLIDVDAIKGEMGLNDAMKSIKPSMIAAFEAKKDVVHPTTGSHLKGQQNKIALAKQYGYTVTLILIDMPVDKAIAQVRNRYRQGGHDVALEKIVASNKAARENYNILLQLADHSEVVNGATIDEAALPYATEPEQQQFSGIWHDTVHKGESPENNPFINNDPELSYLGHGAEAIVIKRSNDESVIRVQGNENDIKLDPYMQYILMSKKYSSNPYFPKVKSIKKIDKEQHALSAGRTMFVIQLEHLVHLDKIPREEMANIINKIFVNGNRCRPPYYEGVDKLMYSCRDVSRYVSDAVNYSAKWAKEIIDPNFANASRLINGVVSKLPYTFIDLHLNNMMARQTAQGYELVLTDPLCSQ